VFIKCWEEKTACALLWSLEHGTFRHFEDEGDRSLAYWRDAQRRYVTRLRQFAEDMLLYCERFRVVERTEGAGESWVALVAGRLCRSPPSRS
jgi:hypothetical protein